MEEGQAAAGQEKKRLLSSHSSAGGRSGGISTSCHSVNNTAAANQDGGPPQTNQSAASAAAGGRTHGQASVVRKNWLPLVAGPALAMESRPGTLCFSTKFCSRAAKHGAHLTHFPSVAFFGRQASVRRR